MADRLHLPRVVRVTAVTLVLTIVAAVGVVRLVGPPSTSSVTPLLPQGIEVGERARGTYRVGEHTVLIAADGITISHPASPRAVWASPRARAFLVAATGTVDTPERRGMLRLSEHIEEVFGEQTVEGADVDTDGRLVITGLLGNEESDERLEYQVFVATSERQTGGLDIDVAVLEEVDRLSLISELDPGEQVHGLGAQFADFDLRGRAYPLIPRAQGVGRGAQPLSLLVDLVLGAAGAADTTGAPLPHMVTSAPRSLWVHGPDVVVADLRQDDRLAMTVWGEALEVSMAVGATPADHVAAHTSAEGVPRRVPEWLGTGLVLGVSEGVSEVRDRLDLLAEADVDVAAVWLSDWAGLRPVPFGDGPGLSGTVDAVRYPDLPGLVEDLADDDIRVLTTVSPMLSPDAAHDGGRDLWQEAAEEGWLVRDEDEQAAELHERELGVRDRDLALPARQNARAAQHAQHLEQAREADQADHAQVHGVLRVGLFLEDEPHEIEGQRRAEVDGEPRAQIGPPDLAQVLHEAVAEVGVRVGEEELHPPARGTHTGGRCDGATRDARGNRPPSVRQEPPPQGARRRTSLTCP